MATKKKMLQAAAGQAGGAGLDITEVFSTYLYDGNGSTQTITNDIDLAGEGGLVWIKARDYGFYSNVLFDTSRGAGLALTSDNTQAQFSYPSSLTSFNSNGFSLSSATAVNDSPYNFASWTFRKAPKFFDVVTYTGDGTGTRQLSHNLGTTVGSVFVKTTSVSDPWIVWHRGMSSESTLKDYYLQLNTTDSIANTFGNIWGSTNNVTDSTFQLGTNINQSGVSYVAYVFAHNDGDGGFGPDGDQDIIKCGSYSQSSASDVDVDLGFEPQFVIVKRSDDTSQWYILDEMRGFLAGSNSTSSRTLYASLANAEADFTIQKTATGFTWPSGQYGSGTQEYIYMAIRRGPLAQPESGTEVFKPVARTGTGSIATVEVGFAPDFLTTFYRSPAGQDKVVFDKMRGPTQYLNTAATTQEINVSTNGLISFNNTSFTTNANGYANNSGSPFINHVFRRAPGFFDVVAYSGNSTAGRTVSHNLGVAPEMMWVKRRDAASGEGWFVYHKDLTSAAYYLNLNSTAAESQYWNAWNSTAPTSSVFSLGNYSDVNLSSATYIAYLFATVPGVSKVGSYTGSNSVAVEVNCGFTSGARFVLIKRTDAVGTSGNWYVYDSVRGIVSAADDPYLLLNTTDAEASNTNNIEPLSSGFKLTIQGNNPISVNGGSYIFYAIA